MIVLAIFNLLAGLGFAYLGRERVRADGPLAPPAFPLAALHAALVALVALYFYAVHPAWSGLYLVDPAGVPALALVPLLAAHVACVAVGWFLGRRLVRTDPARGWRVVFGVVALAVPVAIVVLRARLGVSASYPGFTAGVGRGLFDVELGYAVLVAVLALGTSAVSICLSLVVDARRVRSR